MRSALICLPPQPSGLPRWRSGKESSCQCRRRKRCRFNPWAGRIPCRRQWQPAPVFLPEKKKIPWTEEPCRLQSMGSQRVRPDWASARIHSTAPSDALHPPHCSGTCFCLRVFAPEVGSAQDAPPQVSPWPQVSVFPSLCSKATSSVWPHRPFGLQLIPPPATPVFPRSASFPYQASAPLSLCHLLNECGYCQLSASPPECCQSHEGCDFSFIHSCIHCARNMGQLTLLISLPISFLGFPGSTVAKNLPANAGDTRDSGLIPGSGRSPAVGNGNSSILARKIPWTEDTG